MDNRYDYQDSVERKNSLANQAEYNQNLADTAKAQRDSANELDSSVNAANKRAEEYGTKAQAAKLSAENDARDTTMGKDWSGRTQAKWDEFGENAKAKGKEVANDVRDTFTGNDTKAPVDRASYSAGDTQNTANSHISDPVLREKMDRKDEDFGDKAKDIAHDAGDKLQEGFDKVKGWFNKDDDNSRVQ